MPFGNLINSILSIILPAYQKVPNLDLSKTEMTCNILIPNNPFSSAIYIILPIKKITITFNLTTDSDFQSAVKY